MAKMTEAKVIELRHLASLKQYTYAELGARFDIAERSVGDIVNRRYWKHV